MKMGSRQELAIDVAPQNNRTARANTRGESARCVLCARACLPAPRGLALPVRELVPADYSRTCCCCSSSKLTTEYDCGQ